MSPEKFPSFEKVPVTEDEVIESLNIRGVESPESQELLRKYAEAVEAVADKEAAEHNGDGVASHRANIKAGIKMAILYSKTEKYGEYAQESLEELYDAAYQVEATHDLAEYIKQLLQDTSSRD